MRVVDPAVCISLYICSLGIEHVNKRICGVIRGLHGDHSLFGGCALSDAFHLLPACCRCRGIILVLSALYGVIRLDSSPVDISSVVPLCLRIEIQCNGLFPIDSRYIVASKVILIRSHL